MFIQRVKQFFMEDSLFALTVFLTAFIPLFPKLPLLDIIPGYIVRARLEDVAIALTCALWLFLVIRQKIEWKTPLNKLIFAYAGAGFLSSLSAVVITQTVPAEMLHIGKTLLHYFRYMEYFSLFFLTVSSLTSLKRVKIMLAALCITLLGVSAYGFGQRYYYWPVYSTMNREFSKGLRLYLTEHARVQSTFGGHYDLGGYLVIVLPIVFTLFLFAKTKLNRIGFGLIYTAGVWALMQSASRSSLLGFVVATALILIVRNVFRPTWIKKISYTLLQGFLFGVYLMFMMAQFGSDLYERAEQGLEAFPAVHTVYTDIIKQKDLLLEKVQGEYSEKIYKALFVAEVPKDAVPSDAVAVLVISDTQPTPVEPTPNVRPKDVYKDIPDIKLVATTSAEGVVTVQKVEQPRVFSQTAIDKGLSLAIRYETLWPRALKGFYTNPLLGSGYATLTKETTGQFTEAESTDNNFLRTLGETGALGFITFYGTVVVACYLAVQLLRQSKQDSVAFVFAVAFLGSTLGLLVNAFYIDVFAASKVAYTYWTVVGILTALFILDMRKKDDAELLKKALQNKKRKR